MNFKKYSEEKPEKEGLYIWRASHNARGRDLGFTVTFISKFRERGAGYERIVSPDFDYWDGYNIHVPPNLEWAEYEGEEPKYHENVLSIEGLEPLPDPFSGNIPKFLYSGWFIAAGPLDVEYWYFNPHPWITTPRYSIPQLLVKVWNETINKNNK